MSKPAVTLCCNNQLCMATVKRYVPQAPIMCPVCGGKDVTVYIECEDQPRRPKRLKEMEKNNERPHN